METYNIKKVTKSKTGQYDIEFEKPFKRDFELKFYWRLAKAVFSFGFAVGLIIFFARWAGENYRIERIYTIKGKPIDMSELNIIAGGGTHKSYLAHFDYSNTSADDMLIQCEKDNGDGIFLETKDFEKHISCEEFKKIIESGERKVVE